MRIPADDEIFALHARHAPSPEALDLVYTHCVIVREIADRLLDRAGAGVDARLVRAGCLLHDIGVYRLYGQSGRLDTAGYVRHGLLGHELLRDAGYPEALCRFASRHTGVGISREDVARQGLPLPPADYLAQTPEEILVMYADKFHSKTDPPVFMTAASYAARVRRFGTDKAAAFGAMLARFGEPDLADLSAAYGHAIGTAPSQRPDGDLGRDRGQDHRLRPAPVAASGPAAAPGSRSTSR